MKQERIDRINTLYHKSQAVGLTEEEKKEQAALRKEYIESIRGNMRGQLNSILIKEKDGSITDLGKKYGGVTAEGVVESALDKVKMIEDLDYDNLVISIKSSDVLMCIKAHEILAQKTDYPLHVGITEAGTLWSGNIKSSIGLGIILYEGIGDTIRVSLTGDPVEGPHGQAAAAHSGTPQGRYRGGELPYLRQDKN